MDARELRARVRSLEKAVAVQRQTIELQQVIHGQNETLLQQNEQIIALLQERIELLEERQAIDWRQIRNDGIWIETLETLVRGESRRTELPIMRCKQ